MRAFLNGFERRGYSNTATEDPDTQLLPCLPAALFVGHRSHQSSCARNEVESFLHPHFVEHESYPLVLVRPIVCSDYHDWCVDSLVTYRAKLREHGQDSTIPVLLNQLRSCNAAY